MTIETTATYSRASGNGVTTVFAFTFEVFDSTDLVVRDILDSTGTPTTKTLTTHYTVALSATGEGGTVTFLVAPASGHTIDIRSAIPLTQPTSIRNQGPFHPELHEGVFDRLERQIQDTRRLGALAMRLPDSELPTTDWDVLFDLASRKGKYGVFFNATTGAPELYTSIGATTLTQSVIGSFLYPRTAAEIAAGVTPTYYYYEPGNVLRYGANSGGSVDATAAFNNAIASNTNSFAPAGSYRIDGSITISSSKLLYLNGATLTRGGASTAPMVYVLGTYSELHGGTIVTANASPSGCVVLGNADQTVSMNAWWWRFTDCDVYGRENAANDIGIYVPSGQVAFPANANYFGTIQNINIRGFDVQIWFAELANAHNVNNIHLWAGKTAGFRLRGAYAINASNIFFHAAAANGYVAWQLQNPVIAGSAGNNTSFCSLTNWTTETTGALDKSLTLENACNTNIIAGGSNVLGGYTINNQQNHIIINGAILASIGITTAGNIAAVDTTLTGKQTIGLAIQPAIAAVTGITSGAGVAAGTATTIVPSTALTVVKATLVLVNIFNTSTNNNLCRSDLLLLNLRNSGHSSSTVTVVSSSITLTGTNGDPTTATYTLTFAAGAGLPALQVSIASVGGPQTFTAEATLIKV